ncbi:hypothetical protein BGZ80_011483 [Entomortierella chlamydospora]|uniref:W2 domain-containing protein n=1 Tax=Entomortierella chlamydospora TaxID=101097 RepID=A0A9P6SZK5_9FUNG|nr:hypothetical protein BGZ80_011483 [Entomortierella chlamydospora]
MTLVNTDSTKPNLSIAKNARRGQPKQTCAATESLSSPVTDAAAVVVSVVDAQPEHPSKNVILYSSVNPSISSEEVDDLSSPMGTSVDSNTNDVFDADEMELQHSNDLDSLMTEVETPQYPLPMHVARRPIIDSSLKLERKSRLRRKIDRLQAKNAALKSTVTQVKSDLALERQKRSNMDQIYSNIRKDLSQKLENEEIKVLNLKAEMEQMAAEMKKLKNQLATAKARASAGGKGSSMGYKIGYDSSAFSLSSGISNVGGLMLHHANLAMISCQDDSEEFLLSHSYSSATIRTSPSLSTNPGIAAMSCSDNEDEGMDDEGQSDDEEGTLLFTQNPKSSTPSSSRRASISSVSSLLTLVEEESEEQSEDDDSDDEHEDAPCTMMEIILQRQQARSPEDDMENPPADANETFETMAQNALFQAIQSKSTVGQAHLQLEELVLKYNARLEQAVDVIAKEVSRWWEDERLATGGPISGGWGTENVVINKETGELANPKVSVEKRMESFFGPLLLQFVASLAEQKMLLEKLGNYARVDSRWLKNHNAMLVALYKFDVVEAEAVLEWWKALEEPQGVFGHGGNNLRSLNSRFVAWLEDEEDDSESESDDEEDGSDNDSCSDSDDSDDDSEEDDSDDDEMEQDDNVVDAILDMAYPPTSTREDTGMAKESNSNRDQESKSSPRSSGDDNAGMAAGPTKRRISFCTNNLYYSYDGRICRKKDPSVGEDGEQQENANKKKYQQCPPFRAPGSEAPESDVESATEEDRSD